MEFSFAQKSDLNELVSLYRLAVSRMDEQGVYQWDEIYPSADILASDIERGEMELLRIEGGIAAAFTLNAQCDAEYALGAWRFPESRFAVVHRLCVHPAYQGQGVASRVMDYVESSLRKRGFDSVRLDAFSENPAALRLYEKRGYEKVGEVRFRKGLFYLYEKTLLPAVRG